MAISDVVLGISLQETLTLAGGLLNVGASVSRIVSTWVAETELPQASPADQVRVIVRLPGHVPAADSSENARKGLGSQLSETVITGAGGTAAQLNVAFAGIPTITGAV